MGSFEEILQYRLFTVAGTPVNVATLAIALGTALLTFLLARLAERATAAFLKRSGLKEEGSIAATSRLIYYLVLVAGLGSVIHTLGINLTALFAAGALFAVAVGFAMQNITQNFVSGIILLTEQTIKPGDILEVDGRMLKVKKLGIRSTVARTWDSEDWIIPNSVLVSSTIKNFTLDDKLHRIRCQVGVSYDSDMKQVREVLEKTLYELPWRETSTDPVILMKAFGSSSVDWDVSVWITDPFGRSLRHSQTNEAVWNALKEAGITIAYPQLDLHLDERVQQAMEARA